MKKILSMLVLVAAMGSMKAMDEDNTQILKDLTEEKAVNLIRLTSDYLRLHTSALPSGSITNSGTCSEENGACYVRGNDVGTSYEGLMLSMSGVIRKITDPSSVDRLLWTVPISNYTEIWRNNVANTLSRLLTDRLKTLTPTPTPTN